MLVSHKNKFIFVHIYKNAGRSITTALMPFAASSLYETIDRAGSYLGVTMPYSPRPMEDHVSASQILSRMGKDKYDSYYSFAVVRNPWAWQVSLYEFMRMRSNHYQHHLAIKFRDFEEYIKWRCADDIHHQKDFIYSEDGEQLVNYVGRFESLSQDFDHICKHIGVVAKLEKTNVSSVKPYHEYYNKKSIELVRETFREDIELFEYDYE